MNLARGGRDAGPLQESKVLVRKAEDLRVGRAISGGPLGAPNWNSSKENGGNGTTIIEEAQRLGAEERLSASKHARAVAGRGVERRTELERRLDAAAESLRGIGPSAEL